MILKKSGNKSETAINGQGAGTNSGKTSFRSKGYFTRNTLPLCTNTGSRMALNVYNFMACQSLTLSQPPFKHYRRARSHLPLTGSNSKSRQNSRLSSARPITSGVLGRALTSYSSMSSSTQRPASAAAVLAADDAAQADARSHQSYTRKSVKRYLLPRRCLVLPISRVEGWSNTLWLHECKWTAMMARATSRP